MCGRSICLGIAALVLGMAGSASAQMVVHWKLNEGSGTTAFDASGNGHDGILNGSLEWVEGYGGGYAVHIIAEAQNVLYSFAAAEPWPAGTVAVWVKPDTLGQPASSGVFSSHTPNTAGFQIDVNGGNPGQYRFQPGGTLFGAVTTDWVHLAVTWEATSARLYYNDNLATSRTVTETQTTFNQFAIGINRNAANSLIGVIDEFRAYDRALTDVEILDTMQVEPWPYAYSPNPADRAIHDDTWVTLTWFPGDGAVSHDVYLGDKFEDVNNGSGDTFRGNQSTPSLIVGFPGFPYPNGLVPGMTYYWRVDEIKADGTKYRGKVWSFWVASKKAYRPSPPDGASYVFTDSKLSWSPGLNTALHYVYFGVNADDVNNAVGGPAQGDVTYDPGPLARNTTYYWRVDEFAGGETRKGNVWSFTTLPDIQIAISDPNLVAWWKFDEGQGSVSALDWSGHGHHASLVGEPLSIEGYAGDALALDGDDYITATGYKGVLGGHAFSASLWLKTTERAVQELLWWGSQTGGQRVEFRVHSNGRIRLGNGSGEVESASVVADGQWHHVVITVIDNATNSSSDIHIYIDGLYDTLESADPDTFNIVAGLDVTIGWRPSQGDRPLFGAVDEIRIYDKVLTLAEIELLTRVDVLLAWKPSPINNSAPDIEHATPLTWIRGDKATQHEVFFGLDRDAVADANSSDTTGIYRGRQSTTSYTPAEGVQWGGGPYFWRVDENNSDGTVTKGHVWSFTVGDYLVVDDIESYNDLDEADPASNRIYLSWIDGFDTTTNGAFVGNLSVPLTERADVHGGRQAMPLSYDNNLKFSEATLTLTSGKDWTRQGVANLSLWFRGVATNAPEKMYVALNGMAVVYNNDTTLTQKTAWTEWVIPLQQFASQGVNLTNVMSITIGFGTRGNTTTVGGTGQMYFDDIRLYRPATP